MFPPRTATLALALLASSVAVAQTASTTYVGSCTGSTDSTSTTSTSTTFAATISFAARTQDDIESGSSALSSIYSTYAPNVFGKAECDCNTSETSLDALYMVVQITSALPQGTNTKATAYVGSSGCTEAQTRNLGTQCKQFTTSNLSPTDFVTGSGYTVTNPLYLYVPARDLFDPIHGSCTSNGANSIFIFIGNDQNDPNVTCTVDLSEIATGSSPAVNPRASSGDSAVNLSWDVPTVSNTSGFIQVSYFQVLCADEAGNPIKENPQQAYYSTCTADGIQRRQNIFGASTVTATADGGTTADDAGTTLGIQHEIPADTDATDMSTSDMSTVDMAITGFDEAIHVTSFPNIGPFATLDPKFICTQAQAPSSTSSSVRIGSLVNGQNYQFVVVSVDDYGNATPSALITAKPQPAEDLYGALRSQGSTAHGFCFVATAAFGNYDHPQVRTLRAFRDRVLETSAGGRWFVRTYYRLSPPLAQLIAEGPGRRLVARMLLWPLVAFAELAMLVHSVVLAFLLIVGAVFFLRRRRQRRRALVEATA